MFSCCFVSNLILHSSDARYQKPTESPPTDGAAQAAKGGNNSSAGINGVKVGVAVVVGVTVLLF